MASYLLRRGLLGLITLVVITLMVYGLARSMPGNPLTVQLGESDPSRKLNPEDQQRMLEIYGLDKPWPVGYLQWISKVGQGDLGRSITRKQPVAQLIGERIGPTVLISGTALLLTWFLAIPLGLYASARVVELMNVLQVWYFTLCILSQHLLLRFFFRLFSQSGCGTHVGNYPSSA